jgi:two-component system invasion response regulator UvrY
MQTESTDKFLTLSKREKEIMELLLNGENNKSISKALSLKSNTVSTYKKLIFYKVGVSNLIDLFKHAQISNSIGKITNG